MHKQTQVVEDEFPNSTQVFEVPKRKVSQKRSNLKLTPRHAPQTKKRKISPTRVITKYLPTINKSRYVTRAKQIENKYYNWSDHIEKCVANNENNVEEVGYVYKSITGNVQYCELNLDKVFLSYLKKDMDIDKLKKKMGHE